MVIKEMTGMYCMNVHSTRVSNVRDHVQSSKVFEVSKRSCFVPTAQHPQDTYNPGACIKANTGRNRVQVQSLATNRGLKGTTCHWKEEREHEELTASQQRLETFVSWLVANGELCVCIINVSCINMYLFGLPRLCRIAEHVNAILMQRAMSVLSRH